MEKVVYFNLMKTSSSCLSKQYINTVRFPHGTFVHICALWPVKQIALIRRKKESIFKCYFLRNAHRTEQTPITRVSSTGTHLSRESAEAMQIKCLA